MEIDDDNEEDYQYEEEDEQDNEEGEEDGILERNNDPSTDSLRSFSDEFHRIYHRAQLLYRDTVASSSFYYLIFPIQELLIDYEHLHAFGLENELSIRVDFTVDSSNQTGIITLQHISLYDSSTSTISDLEIGWILKLRLSGYFKEIVFRFHDEVNTQSTAISQVMETTNCSFAEAERALEQSKGDINDALIYLMDAPQNLKSVSPTVAIKTHTIDLTVDPNEQSTQGELSALQQLFPTVIFDTLLSIYQSTYCSFDDTMDILRSQEVTPSTETPISQLINSILRESHHHSLFPLDMTHPNKFLVLFLLIEGEIISCGSRCLICNQLLTYPGILPAVCGGSLCVMGYEELGVGIDLQKEILKNPSVIDLLISFLYSSAFSHRQRLDLIFPTSIKVFDQNNIEHSFVLQGSDGTPCNNYALLQSLLESIPSVSQLVLWCQSKILKEKLNEIHVLVFPLLLWLLRSNRSYLRLLTEEEIPIGIKGKYVFALTSGPMEKEEKFQEIRQATPHPEPSPTSISPHLSFFAFHGSSFGNWHSILRTGFRNFSHTPYMTNGAAHGSGVYFSPKLTVSSRYAPTTDKIWGPSEVLKKQDKCLAICEIINRPAEIKKGGGDIYVVANEELIAPRFLVISPSHDCVQDSLELDYDCVLTALKRKNH